MIEACRDDRHEVQRREFADPGHETVAAFAFLADHAVRLVARVIVEVFLELALDDAALFLDDEDFGFAANEIERALRLEWPDHADLVYVNAEPASLGLRDAEQSQRLHKIVMTFARRNDAESRIGYVEDLAVDWVGGGKRQRCMLLLFEAFLDLRSREIRPAIVQTGCGRRVVRRRNELWIGRQFHGHRRFHGFRYRLETHPHAREARQGNAVQAVLEVLSDVGRI